MKRMVRPRGAAADLPADGHVRQLSGQAQVARRRLHRVAHGLTLDDAVPEADEFANEGLFVTGPVLGFSPDVALGSRRREPRRKVIQVRRGKGELVDRIVEVQRNALDIVGKLRYE